MHRDKIRFRMYRPIRTVLLALVVTSNVACVGAFPPAYKPLPGGKAFQARFTPLETAHTSLPNGVRVSLERDPQSPVVSIGWMVPAGRASDPAGKAGLAHLTEHLVFEAPRSGGLNAIQFFDRSGVEFRGETDSAATRYSLTVHRERFAELLKYEIERMSAPLTSLGQESVRRELRIIREEAASMHPRWQRDAMNSLYRAIFPQGSPLIVDGDLDSLDALTIEDVRQFVAEQYRPEAMRLFVLGDFTWLEAQAALGTTAPLSFSGDVSSKHLASTASPPVGQKTTKMIQHQGFVADNVVKIGWPLPPHLDMVAIEPLLVPMVTSVLPRIEGPSQGRYPSWMPQGALGQRYVELVRSREGSVLMVTAELPPKADPVKIASKIIQEVDALSTKILRSPGVFGLFQLKVTQSSLRETEDVTYRISRLMTQHSLGDTRMSREYFSDINTISHRQAADFSRTWLRKAMAHVLLISPAPTRGLEPLTLKVPSRKTTFDDPAATTMGAGPKSLFPDGRFVWKRLGNGVEVAVLSRPKSTINTLLLGVRSTSRVPELEPIDAFVETARHTPPCPPSAMACGEDVDATSYRSIVSSLPENAPEAARYLATVAAFPRYEWSPGVKDWLGPLLEEREAMPDAVAHRELQSALWREHPKGKRLTTALLQRIRLSDLLQWEQANIRPENTLVVAVTNKDPDELADAIAAQMRPWNPQRPAARAPAFTMPDLTRPHPLQILHATDPSLESARFNFGCLMPPLKTFSERAAAKMVGDWAYRVLFAQLRNQSDASYSTATRVNAYSSGETFMQGAMDVSMDQVGPAIGMFRDLFNAPQEFDDGEISRMKELRRRRVALQNVTGPDIVAEVFDRWTFHMGNPTPLREFDEVEKVSASELATIWNVCRQNAVLQVRTSRPVRGGADRLAY
jgi:predicted Zn-dependent peptidase